MGLIPACAGKTAVRTNVSRVLRAHPRVCGENLTPPQLITPLAGSSPRVRGKRRQSNWNWSANRLIPACAGKTPVA